jgi:hypothetical protein
MRMNFVTTYLDIARSQLIVRENQWKLVEARQILHFRLGFDNLCATVIDCINLCYGYCQGSFAESEVYM